MQNTTYYNVRYPISNKSKISYFIKIGEDHESYLGAAYENAILLWGDHLEDYIEFEKTDEESMANLILDTEYDEDYTKNCVGITSFLFDLSKEEVIHTSYCKFNLYYENHFNDTQLDAIAMHLIGHSLSLGYSIYKRESVMYPYTKDEEGEFSLAYVPTQFDVDSCIKLYSSFPGDATGGYSPKYELQLWYIQPEIELNLTRDNA
ncbi:matrixin family metalloprotease [Chengkuizengella sediminis]|uniref:matrixin family metalloprotease n=1 Tax=Chengkuizengella sediminis TaxID=1885917 RepID=UPI001389C6DB|nr:matrixin family metalloprotease [Chengkuizengella sediminis]